MIESTERRVLVVDDEAAVRRFLSHLLESAGYRYLEAGTGFEAIETLRQQTVDVVLLDLNLPDLSGLDVLKNVREWSQVPVVMLSVQNEERDIVAALDAGADDYLSKPFGTAELLARLRSAIRRSVTEVPSTVFETGDLSVDLDNRTVKSQGELVNLTPTEFDLLKVFIQHPGRVLTHLHLLRAVWGNGYLEEIGLLRVNVSNLRKKIELAPFKRRYILTEPGVGYRLVMG